MVMYIIIICFILTIAILVMSQLTINKGYSYQHKVDDLSDVDPIHKEFIYEPKNKDSQNKNEK